jgi:hypothetical protein
MALAKGLQTAENMRQAKGHKGRAHEVGIFFDIK